MLKAQSSAIVIHGPQNRAYGLVSFYRLSLAQHNLVLLFKTPHSRHFKCGVMKFFMVQSVNCNAIFGLLCTSDAPPENNFSPVIKFSRSSLRRRDLLSFTVLGPIHDTRRSAWI